MSFEDRGEAYETGIDSELQADVGGVRASHVFFSVGYAARSGSATCSCEDVDRPGVSEGKAICENVGKDCGWVNPWFIAGHRNVWRSVGIAICGY